MGQNTRNSSGFLNKVSKQKELAIPGINYEFAHFHHQITLIRQQPYLKNANGLKQKLDSVVAPGYDKDEYFYD